jgi:hypothetical protein
LMRSMASSISCRLLNPMTTASISRQAIA